MEFKKTKMFFVWFAIIFLGFLSVFVMTGAFSFVPIGPTITGLIMFAVPIALIFMFVHKWIFEARNAYGHVVSEKLESTGMSGLGSYAQSFVRSIFTFIWRWRVLFFAAFAIRLNFSYIEALLHATSRESNGWAFLFYGPSGLVVNTIFYFGAVRAIYRREFSMSIKIVTLVTTLSIIGIFVALNTPVDYEKNILAQYKIVDGTPAGNNRQYEYRENSLLFTYPKDWSVIEGGNFIQITPQKGEELRKMLIGKYNVASVGFDIRRQYLSQGETIEQFFKRMVTNLPAGAHTNMDGQRLSSVTEYKDTITIDGESFPYFVVYYENDPSIHKIEYYFTQHGNIYSAICTLAPERGLTEDLCGQIIQNTRRQ